MQRRATAAGLVLNLMVGLACEDASAPPGEGSVQKASAGSPLTQAAVTVSVKPERVVRRPKSPGELILTDNRRTRVEAAYPDARGFLNLVDLEQRLFKKDLKRGKVDTAVAQFDQWAKGSWVLFVGNIGQQNDGSFELPVRYTARDPKDPFGLSSNWFAVSFSRVEGYRESDYRPGELVAILGKYVGRQQVAEARDLVMLEHWDFSGTE